MTRRSRLFVPLLWGACAAVGCESVDLKRMIHQPSFRPYEANPAASDGMAMRQPPPGTVPRSRVLGPSALVDGTEDGAYVSSLPIALDRGVLERGQNRYGIFCAACHGHAGDGKSKVAASMALRKAPSLVAGAIAEYPAGRIFEVVSRGYGLMPSYAHKLEINDRWAVVAYVQALQLSQGVALSSLPSPYAEEAETWLQ
ncbi:MAG: cytochrome c [Polyangiaceae bacterium]|nr:cytochrome c [Polyangiaceae bacterium]